MLTITQMLHPYPLEPVPIQMLLVVLSGTSNASTRDYCQAAIPEQEGQPISGQSSGSRMI